MEHSKLPWQYDLHMILDGKFEPVAHTLEEYGDISREDAEFIVEACNNYERLQAENKAWETNYTNLQAEYEEMASIAYEKSQEVERYKQAMEDMKAVKK